MKRAAIVWLIIAAALVVIGSAGFVSVLAANHWNFEEIGKFETNTTEITEKFENISIHSDTADIAFLPSEDGKCRVVSHEQQNLKHEAAVDNKTLSIKVKDDRQWYEYFSLMFGTPKLTIYLPQDQYSALVIETSTGDIQIPEGFRFADIGITASTGDISTSASSSGPVRIKTSTGNIHVENISAEKLDLSASTGSMDIRSVKCRGDIGIHINTGKAALTDAACRSFDFDGSTGKLDLKNVIADELISVKMNTGDIRFEACDAAELLIQNGTGDVRGSLLSEKVFIAKSNTGRVDVPETINGGKCKIETNTGDISVSLVNGN